MTNSSANALAFGLALTFAAAATATDLSSTVVSQAPSSADTGTAQIERPAARSSLRYGVDNLMVELGALDDAAIAKRAASLRASAYVLAQPSRMWEIRAGGMIEGDAQSGGDVDADRVRGDLTDTYVRWRSGDTRLTLGAQTIVWGRVDAIPLIDRVSRADLTRFVLDRLPDRRRAQAALRWEQNIENFKLDAVVLPYFRGAALPDLDSVWSPIDRRAGTVIGIAPSAQLAPLIQAADVVRDDARNGGGAVRLTHAGEPMDFGITFARTRQSLPYYRVDPVAVTLTELHPFNSFAGVDAEWVTGALTWRVEVGYTRDVPVTRADASMAKASSVDAVLGLEWFPGGGDTRLNLQLVTHRLDASGEILELDKYSGVNGELETSFGQGRWKAGVRFFGGLDVRDGYVAPRIAYLGWEPSEIYLTGHFFDGEDRTLGGFHRDHRMLAIGLRTRF